MHLEGHPQLGVANGLAPATRPVRPRVRALLARPAGRDRGEGQDERGGAAQVHQELPGAVVVVDR